MHPILQESIVVDLVMTVDIVFIANSTALPEISNSTTLPEIVEERLRDHLYLVLMRGVKTPRNSP